MHLSFKVGTPSFCVLIIQWNKSRQRGLVGCFRFSHLTVLYKDVYHILEKNKVFISNHIQLMNTDTYTKLTNDTLTISSYIVVSMSSPLSIGLWCLDRLLYIGLNPGSNNLFYSRFEYKRSNDLLQNHIKIHPIYSLVLDSRKRHDLIGLAVYILFSVIISSRYTRKIPLLCFRYNRLPSLCHLYLQTKQQVYLESRKGVRDISI